MTSSQRVQVFGMDAEKGRWFFIPLGLVMLLCLGTVYSWSIFRKPLEKLWNINATQSLLPFTVLLVLFAVLMPITGFYIGKISVKKIAAVGGMVMGIGYMLSSLANGITFLTFTYGIIAGAGVGIAYGVPIAVVAKWFPDRKGLAVGLTVVGFGLSPLVTAPLAKSLISTYKVLPTFVILGIVFTAIVLGISTTLKLPPKGWTPEGWTAKSANGLEAVPQGSMFQTSSFYALWICYTIGTFVGLSAIGISSPVAQEIVKLDETTAAITVSIFAIFNGLGRPLFGWLTDKFQPKGAAIISYVLILIGSILMLNAQKGDTITYIVAFCLFWMSLGGWLAIAPTATLSLFNPDDYAKNYGIVFTAYGTGALLGTLVAGQLRVIFGSYTVAFYPMLGLAILGIVIAQFQLRRSLPKSLPVTE